MLYEVITQGSQALVMGVSLRRVWAEARNRPAWVPYSKAIALMALNDEEAALAWWQVARRALRNNFV